MAAVKFLPVSHYSAVYIFWSTLYSLNPFRDFSLHLYMYNGTSIARTLMARLPWLLRTRTESLQNSFDSSRKQIFRDVFLFYHEIAHRGTSDEYTQRTIIV